MYFNDVEVTDSVLIDNNVTTCVLLPGYNGCAMDKVNWSH